MYTEIKGLLKVSTYLTPKIAYPLPTLYFFVYRQRTEFKIQSQVYKPDTWAFVFNIINVTSFSSFTYYSNLD